MNKNNCLKTEIIERPCKDNDLTAIVRAESKTGQGEIVDFGYADAESTKCKSAKKILDIARNEALERVKNEAMRDTTHSDKIAADSEAKVSISGSQSMTQIQNPTPVTPKYKHSTTKLASEKQLNWLKRNAYMDTLETLSENMCGKSFYQISSADANTLIKHLENNPQ